MFYSIKNIEVLEKLDELVSLQNQVKALRLQDKLGKQNFHEIVKKVLEPVTETIKDVFDDVTKTMTEGSKDSNKNLSNLNEKLLAILNDSGMIAFFWLSPLSKIANPEHASQFNSVKGPDSNSVNNLLTNKTIPVILYNNLLIFLDTDKKIKLEGDVSEIITSKNFIVDFANLSDRKVVFEIITSKNFIVDFANLSDRKVVFEIAK